jgi:hypothetical protein
MLNLVMLSGVMLNVVAPGKAGNTKANGREPKSCLGRVFNFKLGCFCYECNCTA